MEYQTLFGKMLTASISLMHWVKLLLLRINLEKIKFMQNITTFYGKTIPQIREKLHRRSSKASQQSWHAQRITIPCTCCAAHHQLWIKLHFVMTSYLWPKTISPELLEAVSVGLSGPRGLSIPFLNPTIIVCMGSNSSQHWLMQLIFLRFKHFGARLFSFWVGLANSLS